MRRIAASTGLVIALCGSSLPAAAAQAVGAAASATALVVFQPMRADIVVAGWDRDSVHVGVVGQTPTRLEVTSMTGGVQVFERREPRDADARPAYEVFVPRAATIRVTVRQGIITLRGLTGAVRAGLVEGSLGADSLSGRIELSAVTGPVELTNSHGQIDVRSVAGDIVLSRVSGTISARTTSGGVHITLVDRSTVAADSYSGPVAITGWLGGGSSTLTTHSGNISLRLPGSGDVTLFVTAVRGRTVLACGAAHRPPADGAPLPVGAGGDPVEIVSFEGTIDVRCDR